MILLRITAPSISLKTFAFGRMNWIKKNLLALLPLLMCASFAQGQALTITTNATLPNVVVAEAMSPLQLQASGGTLPYTWSLVTGSQALVGKLATGLSVTSGGQIIGTPTALQAPVGFTVQVTDSSSPKKVAKTVLSIGVVSATPKISLAPMGAGTVGSAYSWTFNATDGKLPYTWSSNSTFPNSLTLNSTTGVLSGNISSSQSPGNFTLAITVSGSNGKSASGNFVLIVNPALAWVTNPALPGGKVGVPYSASLTVTGGKSPYTFATKNGSTLPSGLTLNATTGRLSGTPTAVGNFSFTITAKDSGSPATTIERTFTLAVESYGLSVSGPSTISGQQYQVISPATYSATGGVSPYSWSTVPTLPAALSINATTGVISGSLNATAGNYTVAVRVKDKGNQTATQNVTIAVTPAPSLGWGTPEALPPGKVGVPYSANLTVTGGKPPYTFSTKNGSTLPNWLTLSLNATTCRLSGTPTTPGNFSFTITAKDSANPPTTIERTFTLTVEPYGMSVSGPSTISGQQYKAITPAAFSVTGGAAPYAWSTVPTLPTALSINATTGVISGNLTAIPGNYSVNVIVRDKGNQTASKNCTISILAGDPFVWVTPEALPSGKVATAYSQNLTVSGGKPPYTFATKNGSMPPGWLTLNATTGRLSGTPSAAGNFSFTITAKDSASPLGQIERVFSISIAPYGMEINLPPEIIGTQFQPISPTTISVTGGQLPYIWTVTPALQSGLTLNATGNGTAFILSGVPTVVGNTTLAVRVTDGANQTATKNCTLRILPAGNLTITTANPLPSASLNASYSTTLTASGGKPFITPSRTTYYNWTIANRGNLPANFTLNATTGILSGTANAALTANFSVKVTDAANAFITKNYTLQIALPLDTGDADGDGVNNYREVYDGTDPLDPQSFNPLSVGLVVHYPFQGNYNDESGNQNHLTNNGTILSKDKNGTHTSAIAFTANAGALSQKKIPITGNSDRTISLWIKVTKNPPMDIPPHASGEGSIIGWGKCGWDIGKGRYSGILYLPYYIANSNPYVKNHNITFNGWYSCTTVLTSPSNIQGEWCQLVVVYKNKRLETRYYLNGIPQTNNFGISSDPNEIEQLDTISTELGLNSESGKHIGGWKGCEGGMDDVRIYNRALSAAEVSQLYSEESGKANMVLVQGGTLPAGSALANQTISAFHIARFETTWAEWKKVCTWAAANGYDIGNAGQGSADNQPVRNISWYDALKWCNAKSQKDGLIPVYSVNGTTYKTGDATPTPVAFANGFRLPFEAEWEWAARGGVSSQGYTYSGSNNLDSVAWYLSNSGDGTNPVGTKAPNELGLYDMSGNVAEWNWNLSDGTANRWTRGGSWKDQSESETVTTRLLCVPSNKVRYVGFRYARNAIGDMVTVQGGTLPSGSALANQTIQAFQIGRTEVTWEEWQTVRTWAVANGYTDLAGVGNGTAGNHPIRNVSWYDVVKWSNAKSQMEGLTPVYTVNGTTYRIGSFGVNGSSAVQENQVANGYRLPAEGEWEWAARGGVVSQGYVWSGSNDPSVVAWTQDNSSDGTKAVGTKAANELGIYDMGGNVWEWCWDADGAYRRIRGAGWLTYSAHRGWLSDRVYDHSGPDYRNYRDVGFRLARNIGPKISITGTLPEATLNQAYAGYTFGAVGSTGDKVWTISEGTRPPGMSFSANGTLSGTPTTAGAYTFVIRVDAGGYWDEVEVELEVVASGLKDSDNDGVNDYRETYDGTNTNDPQSFDPLSIGLVAHYPFDGNANDETKNGYDAAGSNLVFAQDRNGTSNSCLALTAPFATSKKIYLASTANRTFSEWVKVVEFPAKTSGAWGPKPNADIAVFPESVIIYNRFSADGQWWLDTGNGVAFYNIIASNQWKHLTVVYQGDISKAKVFLNGVPVPLNAMVLSKVSFDAGEYAPIQFDGSAWNTSGLSTVNLIDNVRVYNRALSDAEVAQLYAKETGGANMVTVQGGTLPSSSGLAGQSVASFRIGKYEVTWDEWQAVRTWALANGYTDLANIGAGSASNHPVRHVNWYDVVKWCNAKSQMEGLTPVYQFSGAIYKTGQSEPTVNTAANGYRLPLEKEWEWAALGGVNSKGFSYSGSNDINAVAWYASNSGLDTKPAGLKTANELMIFDMSGNVAEWCWGTASPRTSPRGGGCLDSPIGNFTPGSLNPDVRALQFGFRVVRNATSAYQFVPGKFTWLEAKQDAINKGGHLATITSQAENNQVKEWLGANYNKDLFIGAVSTNADGKWQWVTGEEFNFSNWDTASYRQPVDLTWPAPHNAHKFANKETWDDVSYGFNAVDGYILEKPSP